MRGDWFHETEASNGASDGPGARVQRPPKAHEDENDNGTGTASHAEDPNGPAAPKRRGDKKPGP